MSGGLINANPTVYSKQERRTRKTKAEDEYTRDLIDSEEIFDILLICILRLTCYYYFECFIRTVFLHAPNSILMDHGVMVENKL